MDPCYRVSGRGGLASATVIAEEGQLCDALSTSLYAMGAERAIEYWR
ncbi:MAG: FAD:protein FMN transferase [Hydrogeniiclostridium mannosilyticum]